MTTTKKYIKPCTTLVQVQAQAMLAGSEKFVISTDGEMNSGEMEAKGNLTINDVWGDDE